VHVCKFARLQVYKIKKSKVLQINNYNFTNASAQLQVHKFQSLQNYKITQSINYKLTITNFTT
jgi:hypothetical protein